MGYNPQKFEFRKAIRKWYEKQLEKFEWIFGETKKYSEFAHQGQHAKHSIGIIARLSKERGLSNDFLPDGRPRLEPWGYQKFGQNVLQIAIIDDELKLRKQKP